MERHDEVFWSTLVEYYSRVFGVAPGTLVLVVSALAAVLIVALNLLRTRCGRCGTWFAAAFVGSQNAGTHHGNWRVLETYRCTTCSHEWTLTRYWRR